MSRPRLSDAWLCALSILGLLIIWQVGADLAATSLLPDPV